MYLTSSMLYSLSFCLFFAATRNGLRMSLGLDVGCFGQGYSSGMTLRALWGERRGAPPFQGCRPNWSDLVPRTKFGRGDQINPSPKSQTLAPASTPYAQIWKWLATFKGRLHRDMARDGA